jgi:ornithine carbamoyltransferase
VRDETIASVSKTRELGHSVAGRERVTWRNHRHVHGGTREGGGHAPLELSARGIAGAAIGDEVDHKTHASALPRTVGRGASRGKRAGGALAAPARGPTSTWARMITITWPPDLLRIGDLTCTSLAELIDIAARMKADPGGWAEALAGQSLACIIDGPATRTGLAAEAAAHRLGMVPVALHSGDLQLEGHDAIDDVGRTLSSYASAVVARHIAEHVLARLAHAATVPIINDHSPSHDPCQALADLLTLRERFGALEGLTVAYVGAAGSVSRSLMDAAALAGMQVRLACPPEHRPSNEDQAGAEMLAERHGGSVTVVVDPYEAVAGADAVYTVAWPEPLRDGEGRERMRPYHVDARLMRHAGSDAVFMHCLPAHRGEEVDAGVIDGRHSVVWEQVANRLPTEEAAIFALSTASHGERL